MQPLLTRIATVVALALLLAAGAGGSKAAEPSQNPERRGIGLLDHKAVKRLLTTPRTASVHIDERKSIFVTDYEVLRLFSFDEVMEQLVRQSGSHALTREQLFEQWFDSANPIGLFSLPFSGPNCDSGLLNGFPYTCPRDEGQLVLFDPFGPSTPATYTPIALSNRFDLAGDPTQGDTDCGEYRIVFERNSGAINPANRSLIIFEAVLPNPQPDGRTLNGCLKVQDFWEDLSRKPVDVRARLLHDFYFKGLAGYEPVVKISHYGSATPKSKGQVRTNEFMAPDPSFPPDVTAPGAPAAPHQPWMLREFHLVLNGSSLRFEPVTVKTNPIAALLNDSDPTQSAGPAFRSHFLTQVAALARPGLDTFSMTVPDTFNSGQSSEQGPNPPGAEMDYAAAFGNATSAFVSAIQGQIPPGSGLQPKDIVNRAATQTCAGCHHLSGGVDMGGGQGAWPLTLGPVPAALFTHEQLVDPDIGPDGPRYKISPALENVFLPHRKCVMQAFLQHAQSANCP